MAKKATGKAKPAAAKNGATKTGKVDGRSKAAREAKKAAANGSNGHNNGGADAIQASFLQHRNLWISAQAQLKVAEKRLKDMVAAAKADGFLKKEFQVADLLAGSPKQEAKVTSDVTMKLRVARWIGHSMGKQLDLFENPAAIVAATPPGQAAYEDGKQAAMEGKTGTPPGQFSGQELAQKWMDGYHAGQELVVKSGIKPLETAPSTQADEPLWDGDGRSLEEDDEPAAGWGQSRQEAPQTVN